MKRIGWFDTKTPLRSGWSWGESYLENGVVAFEAIIGKGRGVFFGPEILKRAQPHGTFKLLVQLDCSICFAIRVFSERGGAETRRTKMVMHDFAHSAAPRETVCGPESSSRACF